MDSDRELELRRALAQLEQTIQAVDRRVLELELGTVKRNGPIMDELRKYERSVQTLEDRVASREELAVALRKQTEELETRRMANRQRMFGTREKLASLVIAVVVIVLQIHPFHL